MITKEDFSKSSGLKKIVFASRNAGKIKEVSDILSGIDILSLDDIGFKGDIKETGKTFEENSELKADAVFNFCGMPTLADDSGLEVEALDNRPGIYSARYADSNEERVKKLLSELSGVSSDKRAARFVCSMTLVINSDEAYFVSGICEGNISLSPAGSNGFGYDPVFIPDGFKNTMAELPAETKNSISHRYWALILIKDIIHKIEK